MESGFFMRMSWVILLSFLVFSCSKKTEEAPQTSMVAEMKLEDSQTLSSGGGSFKKEERKMPSSFMAYSHQIDLNVAPEKLQTVFESLKKKCAQTPDCTLLNSNISAFKQSSYGPESPRAHLELRAPPAQIENLRKSLEQFGEISRQSTQGEDLAAPIGDTEKKLAMLTHYRSQLEALQNKAGQNIESLIKVTSELAQVQSDLEELSGERAHLYQRVNTQLLTIVLESDAPYSILTPVKRTSQEFGQNMMQALSSIITAVAFLIPWTVFVLILVWIFRFLTGKSKNKKAA
jgi:hypothetical protein